MLLFTPSLPPFSISWFLWLYNLSLLSSRRFNPPLKKEVNIHKVGMESKVRVITLLALLDPEPSAVSIHHPLLLLMKPFQAVSTSFLKSWDDVPVTKCILQHRKSIRFQYIHKLVRLSPLLNSRTFSWPPTLVQRNPVSVRSASPSPQPPGPEHCWAAPFMNQVAPYAAFADWPPLLPGSIRRLSPLRSFWHFLCSDD